MVATKTELHGYLHLSTSININRDNYVEDRVLQYVDTVNLRSQHTNHEDTLTNVRPMRSAITHVLTRVTFRLLLQCLVIQDLVYSPVLG